MGVNDDKCRKKKRGHFCVLEEGHGDEIDHQCFCSERWEEVKT